MTPIIVFDGGKLTAKQNTETEREANRAKNLIEAERLRDAGKFEAAGRKYSTAVDITPEMAKALIEKLKEMKIEYYVAPYEADAQLAYLFHQNIVSAVLTEDSDLLIFGV